MLGLTFVSGKCYTYQDLKFYAENGCICLHDEKDGEFKVLTRAEFLDRAKMVGDECKRLAVAAVEDSLHAKRYNQERSELQNVVADMIECCQEASDQGDHFVPEVMEWFMRHRPWARSRVSMNSRANFETAPPGVLPLGRFTGRTTEPPSTAQQAHKKLIFPSDML